MIIFILGFVCLEACQPENELLDATPNQSLQFSTDSVFFDTILTATPSITKRLTIYNPNNRAIKISTISILNPQTPFMLTVQGEQKSTFRDVVILGKDSLRIFVETNIEKTANELPFLGT